MSVTVTPDYAKVLEQQQAEVRQLAIDGLKQIKEGKTKDFNTVCDRLEKNIQMHHYNIKITDLAEQDLENAADYIAFHLKNPSAAVSIVKGIRKQINALQIFPKRNELDDDPILSDFGIRMDYYKKYKIYYIVEKDTV